MKIFPGALLPEQTQDRPRLVGNTVSAGRSGSGVMMATRADGGGLWRYGFEGVSLHTPDQVRAWEALAAYLAGGTTPIIVPICNRRFFPAPMIDGEVVYSYGAVPHDDDTLFSDGSGYDQHVVVATAAAAALRATTLVLSMTVAGELRGGELFTIMHPEVGDRLYRITSVESVVGILNTVRIEPPLREAISAGTEVDFDTPRCVMQVAGNMDLALELRRFGRPSVAFVESFLPDPG